MAHNKHLNTRKTRGCRPFTNRKRKSKIMQEKYLPYKMKGKAIRHREAVPTEI